MKEIWKQIDDFIGYEISNMGRVKSLKHKNERILKSGIKRDGYEYVILCDNGKPHMKTVHRLVGLAFIPNPDNKPEINHIDGNPSNNISSNLEWVTASENAIHAFKLNLRTPSHLGKFGEDNHLSKKVEQRDLKGNLIKIWNCAADAKREGGFCNVCISSCCLKKPKCKTHKKFLWSFHEEI